ncbi:MAG: hypothetical protein JWM19_2286 [Actinomycetia bacterium]|nr:hypothetical protein [Actinomycetes bacterium]
MRPLSGITVVTVEQAVSARRQVLQRLASTPGPSCASWLRRRRGECHAFGRRHLVAKS